jgi:hypothetical protein
MSIVKSSLFPDQKLNDATTELITLYKGFSTHLDNANKELRSAIIKRFTAGQFVYEIYDLIIDVCQTQRNYCEITGIPEAVLSNDLRAYRELKEKYGVDTPEEFLKLLQSKNLKPQVYVWERLPAMLNEPESVQRDQRPKDEKRLEDIDSELKEIVSRNTGQGNNAVLEEARHLIEHLEQAKQHIDKTDPYRYKWRSEAYKKWCRDLGICMLTKEACTTEFHHTDQFGGSGGEGTKLPDVFGIPISATVHYKIEQGDYKVTETQLATALIETMALFIMSNVKEK